jgi:hypothetical protein
MTPSWPPALEGLTTVTSSPSHVLDHAGREFLLGEGAAVAAGFGGRGAERALGIRPADDQREAVLDLHLEAARIRTVVEVAHRVDDGVQPGDAAHLPGAAAAEDVQHLVDRHEHARLLEREHVVARMIAPEPVALALSERRHLNPHHDRAASLGIELVLGVIEVIGLEQLHLERNAEAVGDPARAQPAEGLAVDHKRVGREPLQAVEVRQAVGVALAVVGEGAPGVAQRGVERIVAGVRLGDDAVADDVRAPNRVDALAVGVIAHERARAVA